ncbi:MAG: response regulator transcription factor [Cryomorphaceae bacterium]
MDAIKFSRYIDSKKERICIFFEIHNLQNGYKNLAQLMPAASGNPDMLQKFLLLSHRERQVAGLVGSGLTSREIAGKLHISENTVKNHRKRLKKKLDFNDPTAYRGFLKWVSLQDESRRKIA